MKRITKHSAVIVSVIIMLFVAEGCSRKKNTFTRRAYHNTTARYNAYFNGRELLKSSLKTLRESHTDDYSLLLPLFLYGDEESSKTLYPDMDEVIKKCSKVIERHSIYLKKKEHVRWIDDSYMLIGKARFYKREYFGALEIFEYVERAYRKEPVRVEAMIWIARTYLELESDVKTILTLEKIDEIKNIPEEYIGEFNALYADYFIRNEEYVKAIDRLEIAVKHIRKKKIRRRFVYVLAQLYHLKEDYAHASFYYTEVLKLKPDYIMGFNARINRAKAYDVNAQNSDDIKKELNKMLRDGKNKEFNDQIYFALAELAFREGEDSLGIEYLKRSATSSVDNVKQKSLAYLKLGHIYFDRPDYVQAQAYYDSTSGILEKSHPDYELVIERNEGLTRLVDNINIVIREDSLQNLANMSEKEREKIIRKIIREVEDKEERERQELENSFLNAFETGNDQGNNQTIGKWYFYNQSTKSLGVTEFFSVWGSRKLEDDWRRSNKQSSYSSTFGNAGNASVDSAENDGLSNKDVEYYLKKLPLDDSSMSVSHNLIIEALFQIGVIYKEDFEDIPKSVEHFEKLVKGYDTCRYVASSYYHLYRNNLTLGNQPRAKYYKELILKEFPFSEYARIIENPSYAKQRRDLKEKIEAYYTATYQLYDYRQYEDVISSCKNSDTLFGDNFLKPKFDLLKALAIGKGKDKQAFIFALEEIVINHPTHEVKDRAQEMLRRLKGGEANMKEEAEAGGEPAVKYNENLAGTHVFVLIVPDAKRNINNIKISISNFNSSSFGTSKLSLSAVLLDRETQLLSVRNFKSKEAGMNYLNAFKVNKDKLGKVNAENFTSFIISSENFTTFYKDKNIKNYQQFFEKNYLQ